MAWPQSGRFSSLCPKTMNSVGKVQYPSKSLLMSWQNVAGCLTRPGYFSPPGSEHDSLRSLRQRAPGYRPRLQPQPWRRPLPNLALQTRHSPAQAGAPRASQRGAAAVYCGSRSSRVTSAPGRPCGPDSRSQKPPRGHIAQSYLTCSMDVTVSTESSCNRSRACSGLRLYSGSDQTGEEVGGQ